MYTKWTQHLKDEEEKARFENTILSSKKVLDRLIQILDEEEQALDRSELDIKSFDHPGWAYKQAFKNGYRSSLGVLKKLIDLDQQKKEYK
jgi:hypothetical protein